MITRILFPNSILYHYYSEAAKKGYFSIAVPLKEGEAKGRPIKKKKKKTFFYLKKSALNGNAILSIIFIHLLDIEDNVWSSI